MYSAMTVTQQHMLEVDVVSDPQALARAAARRLVGWADEAIAARGRFLIALAGGQTPRTLYRLLAGDDYRTTLEWPRLEFFFSDERDVPPDHPDSNYRMAHETLLDHVPLHRDQVHPMRSATASLRRDAARYSALLRRRAPASDDGWPQLDVVLLGLGSDGHTASLFPGTCVLHERQLPVAAVHVPQQHGWRLTLTPPVLEHARRLLFLVSGANKAEVLARALSPQPQRVLPVQALRPRGEVHWLCDRAAAAHLSAAETGP